MADRAEKRASRYKHIRADAIRVVPHTGSGPTHALATPPIFRPGPFPDFGVKSRFPSVCSGGIAFSNSRMCGAQARTRPQELVVTPIPHFSESRPLLK